MRNSEGESTGPFLEEIFFLEQDGVTLKAYSHTHHKCPLKGIRTHHKCLLKGIQTDDLWIANQGLTNGLTSEDIFRRKYVLDTLHHTQQTLKHPNYCGYFWV